PRTGAFGVARFVAVSNGYVVVISGSNCTLGWAYVVAETNPRGTKHARACNTPYWTILVRELTRARLAQAPLPVDAKAPHVKSEPAISPSVCAPNPHASPPNIPKEP